MKGWRPDRHESGISARDGLRSVIVEGGTSDPDPREAAMSSEIVTPDPQGSGSRTTNSEQGLLLAVLAMVLLGVAAIFLITA
jgi:hypothetical protein